MVTAKNSSADPSLSSTTNQNFGTGSTDLSSNEIKPRVVSRQVLKALGQRDPLYEAAGMVALRRGLIVARE